MFKKLLTNYFLLSSLFSIILASFAARAEKTIQIDSILIGVYEKGHQLGAQFILDKSSSLLFSINYLDLNLGKYDIGLSEKIPFKFSNKGAQIEYLKFLNNDLNTTGNFLKFGLEFSKLNTSSNIKLSDLEFNLNPLTLTCKTCKNYLLYSNNNWNFIPTISIGRQYKLRSSLFLRTSIGVQYLTLSEIKGEYELESGLPFYVREELLDSQRKINQYLHKLPTIYPTAKISFVYKI